MLLPLARLSIKLMPAPLAMRVIRALATRSQRPPVTDAQREALAGAVSLRYGAGGSNHAWCWGEDGPLVLLVHGWNGRAAQLAPLAATLANMGYRCVALDVTGQGDSPGARTSWRHFIDDVGELAKMLGQPVFAGVGHSAGGLAMMASRALTGLRAQRYVCVCAPSHPYPPVRAIQQRLAPRASLLAGYRAFLAQQFGADWSALESGSAFAGAGADLLLYYDEADRFVDHSEGDRIRGWCPDARLLKSTGCGHTRVLASAALAQAVGDFLLQPELAG